VELKVQLSLSYPSGGYVDHQVKLTITDADACVEFFDVRIPYADFTKLMSTQAVNVTATVRALDKVGKVRRNESERVGWDKDAAEAVKARYEADGWKAVIDRLGGGGGYVVRAERWDDEKEEG